MGKRKLRDDEHLWIRETLKSPKIKDFKGTQAAAASTLADLYRARWSDPRPAETDAEFEVRRKKNKNAQRYGAETKEACKARLAGTLMVRYIATLQAAAYAMAALSWLPQASEPQLRPQPQQSCCRRGCNCGV